MGQMGCLWKVATSISYTLHYTTLNTYIALHYIFEFLMGVIHDCVTVRDSYASTVDQFHPPHLHITCIWTGLILPMSAAWTKILSLWSAIVIRVDSHLCMSMIIRLAQVQMDNISDNRFYRSGILLFINKPRREYEYLHFVLNPLTKT